MDKIYNYIGTRVSIAQKGKSWVVIDLKINEPFSNDRFKTEQDAIDFCIDNKFVIVGNMKQLYPMGASISVYVRLTTQKNQLNQIICSIEVYEKQGKDTEYTILYTIKENATHSEVIFNNTNIPFYLVNIASEIIDNFAMYYNNLNQN